MTNGNSVTVSEVGIAAGFTYLPLIITVAKTAAPKGITSCTSEHPNETKKIFIDFYNIYGHIYNLLSPVTIAPVVVDVVSPAKK